MMVNNNIHDLMNNQDGDSCLTSTMQEFYKIQDLEQVRLLTDPFKLRLLQAFAEAPKTTKQVGTELGENITKLYRHVDALHDAGLLEVVAEQKKRGTVERTFRAIAQRFEADHALFNDETGDDGQAAARELLRAGEKEILGVLANAGDDDADDEKAIVMRVRGRASPEQLAELRSTLQAWLDSISTADETCGDDPVEFGGLVAFYRIE